MSARLGLRGLSYLVLLACVGCTLEPTTIHATQVTLRLQAEAQVQAVMFDVRVQIFAKEGKEWVESEDQILKVSAAPWPRDIVIVPKNGDASRVFEVIVEARDAEREVLVQQRAITSFVANDNRLLEMYLDVCRGTLGATCADKDCHGPPCKVCGLSACVETPMQAPEELPPVGPAPMPDDESLLCRETEDCTFACLGKPALSVKPIDDEATLKLQVLDYSSNLPISKVDVQVCTATDESCTDADASAVSFEKDTGRLVVRGLPQGFAGRLIIAAEGYLSVDFRSLRQIYDTAWETAPILMLTPKLLAQLKKAKVVSIDTTKGAIATRVFDCNGLPAEGATVSATDSASSVLYLSQEVLPDPTATSTDASGQAVVYDVEDAETTLRIKRGKQVIAEAQVLPVPGRLSYVHAYPRRSAATN